MKIALLTLGSHGDVLPFAVLGKALASAGHEVILSTARNFQPLAAKFQLNFEPVNADFQALAESDEGRRMMKNPFQAKKHMKSHIFPMVFESLKTFYSVSREADLALFHVKTMADCFADQFPSRMMKANVVPAIQATSEFPNPVFSGLGYPSMLNKLSFRLSNLGEMMMKQPIRSFRKSVGLSEKYHKIALPSIYGISEIFLPRPADFPQDSYFTGFWHAPSSEPLGDDLLRFLEAGEAPLLITFGSLYFETSFPLIDGILAVVEKLHKRIIVIRGWGINDTGLLETHSNVFVADSAPYDKLLPRVKAVIHHGGIGTTVACLLAEKPFLPCPVLYPMGDQSFWSQLSYQHGFALKPVPLKKMTIELMLTSVQQLTQQESLYIAASSFGKKLQKENGLEKAVQLIQELYAS